MKTTDKKLIERGIKVGDSALVHQDKIWSRYSNDKVDIGETLTEVLRALAKALPLSEPIRALSVGSSSEPQFRILEAACRGRLFLMDIEKEALDVVEERVRRQAIGHVETLQADYNQIFMRHNNAGRFLKAKLNGKKINLVTLHHSLYYSKAESWRPIFENLRRHVLAEKGAVHAVLMASKTGETHTTTWLYNHFAGKFFGHHNDQDLREFKKALEKDRLYGGSRILLKKKQVRFFVDDFEKFMAVVWMILLYPNVHPYTLKQREEITEFIYNNFWNKKRPLIQLQDHLVLYTFKA